MSQELLSRFLPLLSARTGLHVREKDRPALQRALEARLRESSLSHEDYLRTLELDATLTGEWRQLLPRLTNGESYFLRDKGQIALLRDHLLPELIERHKKERSLRLWSAGCSTGEEAYSLAMLISELLPRRTDWNVSILGTDINEESLAKARSGVYGPWAFRSVPEEVRNRYFEAGENGLQISASLRALTKFLPLNLRGSSFPSRTNDLYDIDLILCRNVLIYFDAAAVAHALRGFSAALRPGGYLLTGHAELAGHDPAPLKVRVFAHSVAYQKESADAPAPPARVASVAREHAAATLRGTAAPAKAVNPVVTTRPASEPASAPGRATSTPKPPAGSSAVAPVANVSAPSQAQSSEACCQAARGAADAGDYAAAIAHCREAIAQDATCAGAYALWAQVAMEQGGAEEAKGLWKKVIYLAPAEPEAYLELSSLYEQDGDMRRARQMLETALALLNAVPAAASAQAAHYEAMARHIEELLQSSGKRATAADKNTMPPRPRRRI